MSKLENKIEAHDRTVFQVLNERKYTVDYFQREYKWAQKHIEQLVTDLTTSFLNEYKEGDHREKGCHYNNYFLGPFVISVKESTCSIIDGQQRLTSMTLFFIYLNNLQKELEIKETVESMIFSKLRGNKSFNIQVDERIPCLEQLFNNGYYEHKQGDDESTINMSDRYNDIVDAFPDELKGGALPFFIDWLKYNVVLVEIITYSDENSYMIYETMNDRGLNLTPTEMLKGFVLSKFRNSKIRHKANRIWKESVQQLHDHDKDEDQRFFQAWLRSQYADTMRTRKIGSKNKDFENIGTRFHGWVKDNLSKMNLIPHSSDKFEKFVNNNFKFYLNAYMRIMIAEDELRPQSEHIYYIKRWGIANSLSYPLLLSSLCVSDNADVVFEKMNMVARYIEIFAVRRSINCRKFASSSIRYTIYSLIKEIRCKNIDILRKILQRKLNEMDEQWDGILSFKLHGKNKPFVKFLLARITAYVEQKSGYTTNFETYFHNSTRTPFEIEHVWANKFVNHRDEFDHESDFEDYRNRLGGLVLLRKGTNQSFGAKSYEKKLKHYVKENLIVQSLCEITYQNNPNFRRMYESLGLQFECHNEFKKDDLMQRQILYRDICEKIWVNEF